MLRPGRLPTAGETADLAGWQAEVARLRDALVAVLDRHGLHALSSDANYVLVPGAEGLRDRIAPKGVVVRDCTSFGMPGTVRVAVPDEQGLARLDAALSETAPQRPRISWDR